MLREQPESNNVNRCFNYLINKVFSNFNIVFYLKYIYCFLLPKFGSPDNAPLSPSYIISVICLYINVDSPTSQQNMNIMYVCIYFLPHKNN